MIQPLRSERPDFAAAWRRHGGLLLALLLGLALRLLLWGRIPRAGLISDEGEYLAAADWLAHGRGFAWYLGYLWTRAPLYPLFVAAHFRLFGDVTAPVYCSQILLSLLNVGLIYSLAWRIVPSLTHGRVQPVVPTLAGLLMALYFPFALYTQVLLSETLFLTLLLGAFVALACWGMGDGDEEIGARRPAEGNSKLNTRHIWLITAGVLFGLATLTRSLTLLFIPVVALWLLIQKPRTKSQEPGRSARRRFLVVGPRLRAAIVFLLAAALVILPWTAYNSLRLYGGLVVIDTSGAFNLLLGGRTAFDGNRNDAASRDFVLVLLGQKKPADAAVTPCLPSYPQPLPTTQAQRQGAMSREGVCLIAAKPRAFVGKSLAELIDLFQINPTGAERFANQFSSGRIPPWYALSLFVLDDTLYVLVLPLAIIGWAILRILHIVNCKLQVAQPKTNLQFTMCNLQLLIGLWWLYNLALAPLLFAINRFRLPLLPFAFIFAAYALAQLPHSRRALRGAYGGLCAILAGLLFLIAATPYAYLEPRPSGADSRWASYLGPYPSSLEITKLVLARRPSYQRAEQFQAAFEAGQRETARAILQSGDLAAPRADGVVASLTTLASALLDAQEGQIDQALGRLPSSDTIAGAKDVEAAVVLGDLLRRKGDLGRARVVFSQTFVDNNNPVEWAWDWLHPAPLPDNHIDIAGNLDLGYISGCYLGEGDPQAGGNFRWCTDGARLRFPAAGTGAPQSLVLHADGRGWAGYAAAPPPVSVLLGNQPAGGFIPDLQAPQDFRVMLPPSPLGADVVVTLRSATFVPGADRYLRQQGKAVVGQVQHLAIRLDWAELQ